MPLGPQTQKEDEVIRQAEGIIDKAIINSRSSERVTVAATLLPPLSIKTLAILGTAYRSAGWKKAEMVCDQRDGDFFDLQA